MAKVLSRLSSFLKVSDLSEVGGKIFSNCRENRVSHLIQATWEARTVGWLEAERSLPPGEGFMWPHYGRHAS